MNPGPTPASTPMPLSSPTPIVTPTPTPLSSPTPTPKPTLAPTPKPSASSTPAPKPSPQPQPQRSAATGMKNVVTDKSASEQQQPDAQAARPRPKTIVRDSFTINARRFVSYTIPPNINGLPVRVTGRFEAQGGRNDIECYILDADGFTNFKNGHRTGIYYNSGRTNNGNINAVLPHRGKNYYVVFNNTFSMFTSKVVKTSVSAFYPGQ